MEAGRGWRLVDSPAALAARYHRMYSADDFRAPCGGRGGIAVACLIFMPAPLARGGEVCQAAILQAGLRRGMIRGDLRRSGGCFLWQGVMGVCVKCCIYKGIGWEKIM
jgi:hypothetical protein